MMELRNKKNLTQSTRNTGSEEDKPIEVKLMSNNIVKIVIKT
jgi:hypothetical protein